MRLLGPSAVHQTPREKKPSNASTSTTIRMIQRIPTVEFPLPFELREQRHSGPERYGQAVTEEPLERRVDTPAVPQLDVLRGGPLRPRRRRGALGAQHQIFRRVLGGHELDHVDAVAKRLERGSTQSVGHEVRLASEQEAVPEQRVLLA